MEVTNYLLGYKDKYIVQNTQMFNFSLDSVLLPNFVTLNKNIKNILDIGCGNAPIPLILSTKTSALITGVEIQKDVYDLAVKSVKINNLENQITNRINAYRNGEIIITDLYPIDYKYMFQRKMLTHKEIQEFSKLNLIYGFFEDLSNEEINNIIKNHSYRQIWSFIQTQEVKKHAK